MAITTRHRHGQHGSAPRDLLTDTPFHSSLRRVQVVSMRRTAAFVGAITLLTACSGGDIVVKTDLDESYVVKDSAVTEIEPPIDNRIKFHNEMIKFKRETMARNIKFRNECTTGLSSLSKATCDRIWLRSNPDTRAEIKSMEEHIALLREALDSADPWFRQVQYRPIVIDLNDNKEALSYVTLTCLKPDLDAKKSARLLVALGESVEDVDISKAYYTAGMKVCQKYAYRDSLVFAYREANESDESKQSD